MLEKKLPNNSFNGSLYQISHQYVYSLSDILLKKIRSWTLNTIYLRIFVMVLRLILRKANDIMIIEIQAYGGN